MTELESFFETLAKGTASSYRGIWSVWTMYATQNHISLLNPTFKEAHAFFSNLKNKVAKDGTPLAHKTRINYLQALAAIYGFLLKCKTVESNPWLEVRNSLPTLVGAKKKEFRALSTEEVISMLNAPRCDKRGVRDKAILSILFGAGLRLSELHQLNVGDFRVTPEGVIFLYLRHTKAQESVSQSIPDWCAEAVAALVRQRYSESATNDSPLFPAYKHNGSIYGRASKRAIQKIFKHYAKKCGIERVSPHCARATFVTHLLMAGHREREVAYASRHKTDAMVRVYDKRVMQLKNNVALRLKYAK